MSKKKKPRKKINFCEILYPDRRAEFKEKIAEIEQEEKVSLLQKLEQGVPYRKLFPDDYAKIKATAEQALDFANSIQLSKDNDGTKNVLFYIQFCYRQEVLFPKVGGWIFKYVSDIKTQIELTQAEIEIQAAQINIWLKVWDISHQELIDKAQEKDPLSYINREFDFKRFLSDVAYARIFGKEQTEEKTEDETDEKPPELTEEQKETQRIMKATWQRLGLLPDNEQPTQDDKNPINASDPTPQDDEPHTKKEQQPKINDPIEITKKNVRIPLVKIGEEYHDVIAALCHKRVNLKTIYPKVDPERRQKLLEARTVLLRRDIRTALDLSFKDPLSKKIPQQRQQIVQDAFTELWGAKVADALSNSEDSV